MSWIQTHLTVDKSQAPLIELILEGLGALSVTLGDAGNEPMLEPAPGATPLWTATRVSGLFDSDTDIDGLRSAFNQALTRELGHHLVIERLQDEDWERRWLERFHPMRFGRRLWICPTGHQVTEPGAVVVDLDPGLAFGTGTHPTTELCLRWLDQADLENKTLIDFGCGSGVLGIAALKLGAARVIGIDHDPQAILASRQNAQRNGVGACFEAVENAGFDQSPADIVIANILANVLIDLSDSIGPLVGPGGQLVLSGILDDQAESVREAYRNTLSFAPPYRKEGWVLLHASRG